MAAAVVVCALSACESGLVRQVNYYEKTGDAASALAYLEGELARRPSNTEARFLLGKALFWNERFAEGRAAFDEVERQTARFSESIAYIVEAAYRNAMHHGLNALSAGDVQTAVRHLEHACQIRPESAAARRMLGHALVQAGRLDDAAGAYRTAVDRAPDDVEAWNNLAEIAFVQGRYDEALRAGLRVLELDPDHRIARRRTAHAAIHLGQPDRAAELFETLLASASEYRDVRDYAFFLFNMRRYDAAIPYLEQLAGRPEAELDVLRTLGEAYFEVERYDRVVAVNETILNRRPEDRQAMGNMIAALERLGLFDQAQDWQARLASLGGEM